MFIPILISLLALASGQVIVDGQCNPNVPVQTDFQLADYLGLWYEAYRYEQIFQIGGECVTATYTLGDENVTVVNRMVLLGKEVDIVGSAAIDPEANGGGKLLVHFPSVDRTSPYWVLSTDYNDYSLVYTCNNLPLNKTAVSSWILTRTPELSANALDVVDKVIKETEGLEWSKYHTTDQSEDACKLKGYSIGGIY